MVTYCNIVCVYVLEEVQRKMAPLRNFLTLRQKIEVINIAEQENLDVRNLGKRFNISKTQSAEIVKQKENIRRRSQSGDNLDIKSLKLKGDAAQIVKICLEWFARARSENTLISGPLIKAKERARPGGKL
ncbi:tigger transposable element-derived protein 3-like [Euwallacea fornicatus]|uniref:tigger transposable element-derived protein 3-like n=1 Tax=Euwallacea fornicatus TaxID=995702 RepID=UPI00338FBBD6